MSESVTLSDPQEQLRLECLRLASEVGGTSEAVLKIAVKYMAFVMGPKVDDMSDEPDTINAS